MTDWLVSRDALEEAAAQFILRREDGAYSEDDQREFASWLAQSYGHKAAFWRLEKGWSEADRISALNIAPASPPFFPWLRTWDLGALRSKIGIVAAASILPLLFAIFLFAPEQPAPQMDQFATSIGQRKLVNLTDGTQIDLNTDSRIRIVMTPSERVVYLDRGEAYFDVSHDSRRPFVVRAGDRRLKVLGTQFSVRVEDRRISTGVVEGRVQIGRMEKNKVLDVLVLQGGDLAIAEGGQTIAAYNDRDQVENMIGWQRGLIVLDRSTLGEAARQFNRYNERKLIVDDSETAAIPIGGAFRSRNLDGFVRSLSKVYGLEVRDLGDRVVISKK